VIPALKRQERKALGLPFELRKSISTSLPLRELECLRFIGPPVKVIRSQ
jgi:hypothetical protein